MISEVQGEKIVLIGEQNTLRAVARHLMPFAEIL